MRTLLGTVAALVLTVGLAGTPLYAGATPIGTLSPIGGFAPDDGSELFTPQPQSLAVEIFDPAGAFVPSEFGFYYESDPGTLIPIFESADQDPTNMTGSGTNPQSAVIEFSAGFVFDNDESVIQNTFTVLSEDVGFYYSLFFPGSTLTLFSDPGLNGGTDMLGTFQRLDDLTEYLLVFRTGELPTDDLLSLYVVRGVTGRPAVPERSAAALLGLAAVVASTRTLRRRS